MQPPEGLDRPPGIPHPSIEGTGVGLGREGALVRVRGPPAPLRDGLEPRRPPGEIAVAAENGSAGLTESRGAMLRNPDPVVWAVAGSAALVGALGVIGTDALWLVPLGHEIAHGHLPSSIPFATAPTSGWHNVPAAAELAVLEPLPGARRGPRARRRPSRSCGSRVWRARVRGVRREGSSGTTLAVCGVVLAGSLPAVAVTGISLFSLALFPVLLALLEAETRAPSRRIWLAVPLLAVWGNLHGAAVAGLGLLACYLVLDRARQSWKLAVGVLLSGTLALFLTPALWNTPAYYRGVFRSEPARAGEGLWAPLGLGGFGVVLIVTAVVLAACAVRGGRRVVRLWEALALAGLVVGTIEVARNGTWLLFVLAYPAARALDLRGLPRRLLVGIAVVSGIVALSLLVGGPRDPGSETLARLAAHEGRPVLAQAVLGQQVALLHGKVWVDNPIDAFRRPDQRLYLDWADGRPSGAAAVSNAGARARYGGLESGGGRGLGSPACARCPRLEGRPVRATAEAELRRAPAWPPSSAVGSGRGYPVSGAARDRDHDHDHGPWPRPWSSSFCFGGPLLSPARGCGGLGAQPAPPVTTAVLVVLPAPIVACVPDELKPPVAENVALKLPRNRAPPPRPPTRKPWTLPFTSTAPSVAWKWPGVGGVAVPAIWRSPVSDPAFVVES